MTATDEPEFTMRLPSYPWRFAHLAALWGYGVSQPIFSMLKGNPEFLVINGASRAEAVAFAVLLAFGHQLFGPDHSHCLQKRFDVQAVQAASTGQTG